jgi:predicted glutamine amidotransferase
LKNLLKSLNLYTLTHQIKLNRVKKSFDLLNADLILARDATKVLFKANMTKETRKKTKKNINARTYRTSFERVLIENEAIRLRKKKIKKNDETMQKKMTAKTKKSVAAEKKRIHAKEVTMRKKKRKEDKIVKELKKTSKSKRFYRRRLQYSFVSVFSTLQMRETALEIEQSILLIEKSEVDNSASFMRDYTYQ